MLIDFTMKNFASFRNEVTLSAEVGERLRKYNKTNTFKNVSPRLLKNLLIFGPNGAGKTQIINGLLQMQRLVLQGGSPAVSTTLEFNPFYLDETSRNSNTKFCVKLLLGKTQYKYVISYNARRIEEEALFIGNKEQCYFKRIHQIFRKIPNSLKVIEHNIRPNGLFLYFAQQANDSNCAAVYKWFDKDLINIDVSHNISEQLILLMKRPRLKEEMVNFLQCADFNISDIKVEEIPAPSESSMSETIKQVLALTNTNLPKTMLQLSVIHDLYDNQGQVAGKQPLLLSQESLGTGRLFKIMLQIISAQVTGNKKTILIDEFDDSLHSELSQTLVKIFNSTANLNQFILTTHNLSLMDQGIRVDQIYLVEKDFHGISDLNSIFDFNDSRNKGRLDINFAKRYIQGRYGAVPVIDTKRLEKVLAKINKIRV